MSENAVLIAGRALHDGVGLLRSSASSESDRLTAIAVCESLSRQLEQLQIALITGLDRDGAFADRGYRSTPHAVGDLLGWDTGTARRRVTVGTLVCPRTTLDGQHLPAALPATAAVFAAGEVSLRHVEVIAEALRTPAAYRLEPGVWAGAEEKLAEQARLYRPAELAYFAADLIATLDQDGPEPDDGDGSEPVNELRFSPRTGKVTGQLYGLTRELLATALDALTRPGGEEDDRSADQRRADALGEICRHSLDSGALPECGAERPHVNVIIDLEELERRARVASLDFGSRVLPADLRALACDARVVPIVMNGAGQPLDVGRARRTIPDGIRRAVAARDRGCSFPGCDRPPSWSEIHHVVPWEDGGVTAVHNCAMVCSFHHRLMHRDSGWVIRIRDGLPEFIPPQWIDDSRAPRRKPPPAITRRT